MGNANKNKLHVEPSRTEVIKGSAEDETLKLVFTNEFLGLPRVFQEISGLDACTSALLNFFPELHSLRLVTHSSTQIFTYPFLNILRTAQVFRRPASDNLLPI